MIFTWLSIHLKPTAAEHSFLEALLNQSRLYTLSRVFKIEEMFPLLVLSDNISPLELTLIWLFKNVSNQPLPDLCIDTMQKNRTGLQAHSFLHIHVFIKKIRNITIINSKIINRKKIIYVNFNYTCWRLWVVDNASREVPILRHWKDEDMVAWRH